ncbi:hypothetical protein ACFE04_003278 [Oxalis oulophora]
MDTNIRRDPPPPKSGGKILRPRRHAVAPRTPYERPNLRENSPLQQQNPNWISRLILSPTRMVVSGTGKILSTVFGADSDDDDSSVSDSSSNDEVDDEIDTYIDGDDNSFQEDGEEEKNEATIIWRSQTKSNIEQLIRQETFSREEGDWLITTIKSRVVDPSITVGTEDQGLIETPSRAAGNDGAIADLRSTAIMEARKWLEDKKLGSNSTSKLNFGTSSRSREIMPYVTESELGSPVDVAKSYMQTRPAWASPSVNHMESKSPFISGMQLFKDGSPYSIGANAASSSKKKRDYSGTGSWNILEEIRKVRSKASEEMLRTLPSKIDWSSFTSEHKSRSNLFAVDRPDAVLAIEANNSAKPVDESLNLTTGAIGVSSVPLPVSKTTAQDELPDEALSNPIAPASEQTKDVEADCIIQETRTLDVDIDGHKDTNGTVQHDLDELHDASIPDENHLAQQVPETDAVAANGLPSSGSSPVEQDGKQNSPPHLKEHNPSATDNNKIDDTNTVGTHELLSEASVDVPTAYENEHSIPSASQNSSSMYVEGSLTQGPTRAASKRKVTARKFAEDTEEKQSVKKVGRQTKRGRGRGK